MGEPAEPAKVQPQQFMRYIYTCIEQLDLAAHQLAHVDNASYGRFALILTDNVVELLLHRFCSDEVLSDQRSYNRSPKFTAKERSIVQHGLLSRDEFVGSRADN